MDKAGVPDGWCDSQVTEHGKSPTRLPVNAFLGQVTYCLFASKDEELCAQCFNVDQIAILLCPRTVREPFFIHGNVQLHATRIRMGQANILHDRHVRGFR
jgi:hypothetical protein